MKKENKWRKNRLENRTHRTARLKTASKIPMSVISEDKASPRSKFQKRRIFASETSPQNGRKNILVLEAAHRQCIGHFPVIKDDRIGTEPSSTSTGNSLNA